MAEIQFEKAALTWSLTWDADWPSATTFVGSPRRVAAGNLLGQILIWDLPEKATDKETSATSRLGGH